MRAPFDSDRFVQSFKSSRAAGLDHLFWLLDGPSCLPFDLDLLVAGNPATRFTGCPVRSCGQRTWVRLRTRTFIVGLELLYFFFYCVVAFLEIHLDKCIYVLNMIRRNKWDPSSSSSPILNDRLFLSGILFSCPEKIIQLIFIFLLLTGYFLTSGFVKDPSTNGAEWMGRGRVDDIENDPSTQLLCLGTILLLLDCWKKRNNYADGIFQTIKS